LHRAVKKFDYVGNAKEVLIESGKEKDFVFLDRQGWLHLAAAHCAV